MTKERFQRVIALAVCVMLAVGAAAAAPALQLSASAATGADVRNDQGIVEGQSKTLVLNSGSNAKVKWSSSNEKVISCSSNGTIRGISKGTAVITAKQGEKTYTYTFYCAKKLQATSTEDPKHWLTPICSSPSVFGIKGFHSGLLFMPNRTSYKILGTYGNWFYVSYSKSGETVYGFMLQYAFGNSASSGEEFWQLSRKYLDVFCGERSDIYRLTTDYKGNVKWSVADTSIVEYNESTGEVYGKKTGETTISATANGKTLTCTVRVIYHWKQSWRTKLISSGDFYMNSSQGLEKKATLAKGASFFICGDMGTQDKEGWVYGSTVIDSKELWGYIRVNAVSQKGTVSQYRALNWLWPVKKKSGSNPPTYISSPYGKRDTNPSMHKGMDITTGVAGEINGYEVVAVMDGKVKRVYTNPNKDYGYAVAIESSYKDPISGLPIMAIYMHLKYEPKLEVGSSIKKGSKVGNVGNTTNYANMGYHLHFEANNRGAAIGDQGRQNYSELINPLFFYDLDAMGGTVNPNSDAVKKYYGAYWYGHD